jgi:hypothetical protein
LFRLGDRLLVCARSDVLGVDVNEAVVDVVVVLVSLSLGTDSLEETRGDHGTRVISEVDLESILVRAKEVLSTIIVGGETVANAIEKVIFETRIDSLDSLIVQAEVEEELTSNSVLVLIGDEAGLEDDVFVETLDIRLVVAKREDVVLEARRDDIELFKGRKLLEEEILGGVGRRRSEGLLGDEVRDIKILLHESLILSELEVGGEILTLGVDLEAGGVNKLLLVDLSLLGGSLNSVEKLNSLLSLKNISVVINLLIKVVDTVGLLDDSELNTLILEGTVGLNISITVGSGLLEHLLGSVGVV